MTKTKTLPNYLPEKGSKAFALLHMLLRGERVTSDVAYMDLNIPALQARVSELRRRGWPIRTLEALHPRLKNETIAVYRLDEHFRHWVLANPGRHPGAYPGEDGRGKFADWTEEDYGKGTHERRYKKS
jgi:hypothetical protein